MNDHNPEMNDKEIRDLLKWRLLEQVDEDDLLTQKLTDMEAKLAFGSEALYMPSLQKEKELLEKLKSDNKKSFFRWIFPLAIGLSVLAIYFSFKFLSPHEVTKNVVFAPKILPVQEKATPLLLQVNRTVKVQAVKKSNDPVQSSVDLAIAVDTVKKDDPGNTQVADPGIKVEYVPGKKHDPKFVDAYDHIPVLTQKQISANNKLKEKMIKALMKKDKSSWALIRMGTENIGDQKISYYPFYIATSEVTNNQYRVFLNDLIIKDKIDEYMKAVPDTTKWRINPKMDYEPMVKNYFWHPAYNDFPVLNVSREGAKMYCDWLTNAVNEKVKESNKNAKDDDFLNDLRIPNEIEWVAAARGGLGDVPYPWTIKPENDKVQNYKGCYLCNFSIINYPDSLKKKSECSKLDGITSAGSVSGEFYFTCKVDSYNPNMAGLFCISGNAAEMVWENETKKAITKGGSWNSDAEHVKINSKENDGVTDPSPYIGFRPVFTAGKLKK